LFGKTVADAISSKIPYKLTSNVLVLEEGTLTVWVMVDSIERVLSEAIEVLVADPSVSYKSGSHLQVGSRTVLPELSKI
jgi:hypothetical protein